MRILHILDHSLPLHSGYTFRTLAILKQQRALGWETYHLTSPKQEDCTVAEEEVDGWHFYRTRASQGVFSSVPVLREFELMGDVAFRIEEIVKRIRPHVLHAHSPVLNAIPALRVGRRLGIPVVYEVRAFWEDAAVDHGSAREWGVRYRLTRALETFALKRADAVTTICEGLRSDIVGRGIGAAKVTVIPNAVNVQDFAPVAVQDESLKQSLGLAGRTLLGFIGSFYAYEGLHLLLRALPIIRQSNPQVAVLLVGGGHEEARLKSLVQDLGLQAHVVFTGRVPHQQVQRYYDLLDLLVYPRLKMRLTDLVTPLKPLEAMAQGRIVLASDVGGHRELIRDGETGFLFTAGDERALARSAVAALADAPRREKVALAARLFVEQERAWPISVAGYKSVYGSLVRNAE